MGNKVAKPAEVTGLRSTFLEHQDVSRAGIRYFASTGCPPMNIGPLRFRELGRGEKYIATHSSKLKTKN
jgi:hypothetical protein